MKEADKYLKYLLWPLSTLENTMKSLVRGTAARFALSSSYLIFDLILLIGLPLLLSEFSGGFLNLDYGIILLLLVSVAVREECYRGLNRATK
jgi:hypothetical protein